MKRRHFITSATYTWIPFSLGAPFSINAKQHPISECGHTFFYDQRFPKAHQLSSEIHSTGKIIAVQSDVTQLWRGELRSFKDALSFQLSGVTTESFYFCLKNLLQEKNTVTSSIERVDKDLHYWSIHSEK